MNFLKVEIGKRAFYANAYSMLSGALRAGGKSFRLTVHNPQLWSVP